MLGNESGMVGNWLVMVGTLKQPALPSSERTSLNATTTSATRPTWCNPHLCPRFCHYVTPNAVRPQVSRTFAAILVLNHQTKCGVCPRKGCVDMISRAHLSTSMKPEQKSQASSGTTRESEAALKPNSTCSLITTACSSNTISLCNVCLKTQCTSIGNVDPQFPVHHQPNYPSSLSFHLC